MRGLWHWSFVLAFLGTVTVAEGRGRPVRPAPPAPAPVVVPQLVPTGMTEMARMLNRMRIRVLTAASGTPALDDVGPGRQIWFVLPLCRTPGRDDAPGTCVIDRLRIEPEGGGSVHAGLMRTVTVDGAPQRVQVFAMSNDTHMLRIRLITTQDQVRYQAVVETSQLGDLPLAPEHATVDGFSLSPTAR